MLSVSQILSDFQQMLTDHWGYIPGSSGQKWTQAAQDKKAATDTGVAKYGQQWVGHTVADCSGAFVYAYRKAGLSIYHGSNRIAREWIREAGSRRKEVGSNSHLLPSTSYLLPISEARPGMAAFKAYKPGDKYYSLPAEYKQGGKHYNGDLLDYYHIGLVDADGEHVINAASTKSGVIRSKLDGWCAVGYLKDVDYEGGEEPMGAKVIVTSENGKPVNLRSGPGVTYNKIAEIDVGTEAERLTDDGEWSYIRAKGKSGYMKDQFLIEAPEATPEQTPTDDTELVPDAADEKQALADTLLEIQRLATAALEMLEIYG